MRLKEFNARIEKLEQIKDTTNNGGMRVEFVNGSGEVVHVAGPSREKALQFVQFDEEDFSL